MPLAGVPPKSLLVDVAIPPIAKFITPGSAQACKVAEQMSATRSSTAQDMARRKRTEIDSLNGYIARRAEELGVAAPVNHALYTLVKMAEKGFQK